MSVCPGCGGIVGRDCFNPSECEWISRDMEARAAAERILRQREEEEHWRRAEAEHWAEQENEYLTWIAATAMFPEVVASGQAGQSEGQ